ncbi:MAG: carbamoyltransferase HypF [Gemmataceae bacterium]
MTIPSEPRRLRLRVRGVVQGVGFRPFVYALAGRHGLTGLVGNDSDGVFVEVQGEGGALAAFRRDLVAGPPPLARIDGVDAVALPPRDEAGFVIAQSEARPGESTPVPPDVAVCDDCLRELFDPADRRFRYPFINCTGCGPRFTIILDLPYDRPATTMAGFRMCADCEREYHDPASRRFHAQPNACPRCGPALRFLAGGNEALGEDALGRARDALAAGRVVAVKGVGGFHLACDATSDDAVAVLRQRKRRTDKPFAVLFASLEVARRHAMIDEGEARVLTGRERPIVLVRRRPDAGLSGLVAPGNDFVGALLPYSPLHHLLVDDRPLVFTSANLSDEPIVKDNEEALSRLSRLADAFLMHDRDIHVVCDDSVVRCLGGREYPVRRSRGYAPLPVPLPRPAPPVLAVGGELKATFCLTRGDRAYVSQHIGDMGSPETLAAFERAFGHFEALFRTSPAAVACDAHPGYLSTRWAAEFALSRGLPRIEVQHHHAHVAALMAEHGLDGLHPVIGVCFDGTGYGPDGAIWGGELLVADYRGFERLAHLPYVPLPGGDTAVRRPYRAGLAHLFAAGLPWDDDLPCVQACPPAERRVLARQLEGGFNCVPTSSAGRLFDAVAALINVRQEVTYEAQAAIELEALADAADEGIYSIALSGDPAIIDLGEMFRAILMDLRGGVPRGVIASRFHRGFARLVVSMAEFARRRTGLRVVGLTGGVFQNVRLLRLSAEGLSAAGFEVLVHERVPANDGGLALGQAAVVGLGRVQG